MLSKSMPDNARINKTGGKESAKEKKKLKVVFKKINEQKYLLLHF